MKRNTKGILTLAILAIFGFSSIAYANWGGGYGHMMGPGMMGPGWQRGGGNYGNLTADELAKLDQQRSAFFRATENIRQQLYEKNLALQSELAKENPDVAKASKLQSEISGLQSDFDQKRLEFTIQSRKLAPNYNQGYGGGHRSMMGYGPHGGGYCGW